jgi:hypothetical protein
MTEKEVLFLTGRVCAGVEDEDGSFSRCRRLVASAKDNILILKANRVGRMQP